jgi:hypothetical protein
MGKSTRENQQQVAASMESTVNLCFKVPGSYRIPLLLVAISAQPICLNDVPLN